MAIKVLMVCLGNICRSPLAEGILQNKVDSDEIHVDSAGTGGYHIGSKPDPRSIEVGKRHSIDISHQRCRQFTTADFDAFVQPKRHFEYALHFQVPLLFASGPQPYNVALEWRLRDESGRTIASCPQAQ